MTSRSNQLMATTVMTSSFPERFFIRAVLISYRIFLQKIQSIYNNYAIRPPCQIHLHSSRTLCRWNHSSDCEVNCEVDPAYRIRKGHETVGTSISLLDRRGQGLRQAANHRTNTGPRIRQTAARVSDRCRYRRSENRINV